MQRTTNTNRDTGQTRQIQDTTCTTEGTLATTTSIKRAQKALSKANSVYDLPSTKQAIKWMHAVCGFPVKSTWMKAITAGNYIGWPMLTVRNINKYYPETNKTPKDHLNQTLKNVRSTRPLETSNPTALQG